MIGDRIKDFLAQMGLKLDELAEIAGISQGALSDIKNNKRDPRGETIAKLVRNTDINAHWLLTGEGPMTRHDELGKGTKVEAGRQMVQDRLDPEIQALVSDLIDILRSDDTVMKKAITENIKAFKESVGRKTKLERSEFETDFKIQGTSRVSRQPGEKHRAGGK